MGMFGNFIGAFKEGFADTPDKDDKPQTAREWQARNVPAFATYRGYMNLPYLVHQCMTRDTVDVRATHYFNDIVGTLPTFRRMEFKVLKATKRTTPESWQFDPGDASVFTSSGQFIGVVDSRRFEKLGGKTGMHYGFVEPPSYDFDEDHGITQEPRVFLFCDYHAMANETSDVIIGWRP